MGQHEDRWKGFEEYRFAESHEAEHEPLAEEEEEPVTEGLLPSQKAREAIFRALVRRDLAQQGATAFIPSRRARRGKR